MPDYNKLEYIDQILVWALLEPHTEEAWVYKHPYTYFTRCILNKNLKSNKRCVLIWFWERKTEMSFEDDKQMKYSLIAKLEKEFQKYKSNTAVGSDFGMQS